ncbi:hypothetical protein [Rhizobium sp. 1399]|uniref:hypothetical protein n=1 Tax=Rhizobium sp. 1399 TaxID=2817758 RepID=UPI002857229D|nr:hypothetical protein [Rhizobium sp. 1399]MDR6668869.1 hypothetical protein [Rhizobium sp. 1399]
MINSIEARRAIAQTIGKSLDELVRDRMTGLVEEPDITSRIGQRLEDRFDGAFLAGYKVSVISETITSHGAKSLERPMGTDLYIAMSVEDKIGHQTSKGILIQAKRRDKLSLRDLGEQCRRMNMVTKKGSVVWIYDVSGIDVIRSEDVLKAASPAFSSSEFFERVLECNIGDKRKVPTGPFGDRPKLKSMLETLGARNAVWLEFDKS